MELMVENLSPNTFERYPFEPNRNLNSWNFEPQIHLSHWAFELQRHLWEFESQRNLSPIDIWIFSLIDIAIWQYLKKYLPSFVEPISFLVQPWSPCAWPVFPWASSILPPPCHAVCAIHWYIPSTVRQVDPFLSLPWGIPHPWKKKLE